MSGVAERVTEGAEQPAGCLSEAELEMVAGGESLMSSRRQHLDTCEHCKATVEQLQAFDPRAAATQFLKGWRLRQGEVPRAIGIALGGAVAILLAGLVVIAVNFRLSHTEWERALVAQEERAEAAERRLAELVETTRGAVFTHTQNGDLRFDDITSASQNDRSQSLAEISRFMEELSLSGAYASLDPPLMPFQIDVKPSTEGTAFTFRGQIIRLPAASSPARKDCDQDSVGALVPQLKAVGSPVFFGVDPGVGGGALADSYCAFKALNPGSRVSVMMLASGGEPRGGDSLAPKPP